jgi:ribosome biogenesis GTPase / thiamine phosphate phosphatase
VHAGATDAFVTAVDRGRYRCWTGAYTITAMKARELGRGGVVVGDRVRLTGDVSGEPGTLARVVQVQPRRSVLRRSADDDDPVERIVVANADQLVIVTALADPPPRARLIDRFLVAAYDAGIEPLLCLTKADLAAPDALIAAYEPLGIRFVVTARPSGDALTDLRILLSERISVMVGHSGVGKSTLVNALVPAAERAVGTVSPVTGRGRHTSSSAVALPLPDGGWIIDTPGLRSFGLAHVAADRVVSAFPEFTDAIAECDPGCSHIEAGCALDDWAAGHGASARLDSLRRLLRSQEGLDPGDEHGAD